MFRWRRTRKICTQSIYRAITQLALPTGMLAVFTVGGPWQLPSTGRAEACGYAGWRGDRERSPLGHGRQTHAGAPGSTPGNSKSSHTVAEPNAPAFRGFSPRCRPGTSACGPGQMLKARRGFFLPLFLLSASALIGVSVCHAWWPKTVLLPVWPGDAGGLDTAGGDGKLSSVPRAGHGEAAGRRSEGSQLGPDEGRLRPEIKSFQFPFRN